jgi:arylsulfatase A-like enzyme
MRPRLLFALFTLLPAVAIAADSPTPAHPNILFILADDLGWSDLGCNGGDLVETPAIDRFAKENLRFTDCYGQSICTPSRAALMTGQHPARLHMTTWSEAAIAGTPVNRKLLEPASLPNLAHTETTLAQNLHDAGYLTALIGKWHLGDSDHFPESFGFDVNIGGNQWGATNSFFWPYSGSGVHGPEFRFVPHLELGHPGEYLTDRLTDEAIRVMDHAGSQPFFIYLAHYAVHTPVEAKDGIDHFKSKLGPGVHHKNAIYAAMTRDLDVDVDRVLAHLHERGLDGNTIVVFASDNGGYTGLSKGQKEPVTNNYPLRSGKGSLYEGGIRVPLIVRWPGLTPHGAICHEPVQLMDMFYTLTAGANIPNPKMPANPDGIDITPVLKDPDIHLNRDALYFHFPHYYGTVTSPVSAIRSRDWKLLEYFEDHHTELYNLKDDLSEKTDLSKQNPEKTSDLLARLHAWQTSVNVTFPTQNPAFQSCPRHVGMVQLEDPEFKNP